MKALFRKFITIVNKIWHSLLQQPLVMLLIIVGLVLFIVSWLVLANVTSLVLSQQLLASLAILFVYVLLIVVIYFVRYAIKRTAELKLAQRAQGVQQADVAQTTSEQLIELTQFLFHKLNCKRYIPLILQSILRRKTISIAFASGDMMEPYFKASKWRFLDSPRELPINIWVNGGKIMIVINPFMVELNPILKLLAKYSFLRHFATAFYLVDIKQLTQVDLADDVFEQISTLRRQLDKYWSFRRIEQKILLYGIEQLPGADELITIPDYAKFFPENNDIEQESAIDNITIAIQKFCKTNPEAIDNAKLYWLLNSLADIHDRIRFSDSQQSWLLLDHIALVDRTRVLQHTLVRINKAHSSQLWNKTKLTMLSTGMLFLIVSLIGVSISFITNYQNIHQTTVQVDRYQKLPWKSYNDQDLTPVYRAYEIYSLYDNSNHWLAHMGLYQGDNVKSIVKPLLQKQLNQRFVPLLQSKLAELLQESIVKKDNITRALSSYLMLNQQQYFNASYVNQWLSENNSVFSTHNNVEIINVLPHVGYQATSGDSKLVGRAKAKLPSLSSQIRLQLLKQSAQQGKINIYDELSSGAKRLLSIDNQIDISNIYSRKSLLAAINNQSNNVVERIVENIWFYNTNEDLATLKEAVLSEYIASYINQWNLLINKLDFVTANSLDKAEEIADDVSSSDSVWQQLANIIVENTHFANEKSVELVKISNAFSAWHQLMNTSSGKHKQQKVSAAFNSMQKILEQVVDTKQPNESAFKLLQQAMITGEGIAEFEQLQVAIKSLPIGLQHWLLQLRSGVTYGLFAAAHQHIIDQLKPVVANNIDNLLSQYPFDANSQNDADPAQLAKLFGKDGVMSQFVANILTPFYAIDRGKAKTLYSAGIRLSNDEIKFYRLISDISNKFFGNNGDVLQISFTIKPTFLSNSVGSARLNLLNRTMRYQHGPQKTINYSWPTELVNLSADLQLVKFNGNTINIPDRGIWAWMRLIAKAQTEPTSTKNVWKLKFQQADANFQLQVIASPAMNVVLNGELTSLQLASSIVEKKYD